MNFKKDRNRKKLYAPKIHCYIAPKSSNVGKDRLRLRIKSTRRKILKKTNKLQQLKDALGKETLYANYQDIPQENSY